MELAFQMHSFTTYDVKWLLSSKYTVTPEH